MNSIVLNPKVAACDIFNAFTSCITFDGEETGNRYVLCCSIGTNDFYWEVCEYIKTPEGYRGNGIGKKMFSYKFSRHHSAFRSADLGDHMQCVYEEFRRFHSLFMDNESKMLSFFNDESNPVVGLTYDEITRYLKIKDKPKRLEESPFSGFHSSNELPDRDSLEEDLSEYVLIDIYGNRNWDDFEIGYFDYGIEKWCLKKSPERYIDLDHMKWAKLPLKTENHSRTKEPLAKG